MKQKGFVSPIVLFIAGVLVFGISLVVFQPTIPIRFKDFITSVLPKSISQYTEERRLQDAEQARFNEKRDQGEEGPLTFVQTNLSNVNQRFYLDIISLTQAKAEPVSCLTVEGNEYTSLINVGARTSDPNIAKFTKEIENYKFSDETTYTLEDGRKVTENIGERSTRVIGYQDLCELNGIYFFLFEGTGSTVQVGGGGSAPSHFAYSDVDGKLIIIEDIPTSFIKLPPSEDPNDYSIPTTTGGIAYYGCRQVYAANKSEVLIGCGGGDGPASGGGIFRVDLASKIVKEKVFCFHNGVGKYATRCYNESGKVYHQELNQH